MLSTLFKVSLKRDHTRDTKNASHSRDKKCITHGILKKDHTQDFLLSLKLLNIRQLKVSFSNSIFKYGILQLNLVSDFFARP